MKDGEYRLEKELVFNGLLLFLIVFKFQTKCLNQIFPNILERIFSTFSDNNTGMSV